MNSGDAAAGGGEILRVSPFSKDSFVSSTEQVAPRDEISPDGGGVGGQADVASFKLSCVVSVIVWLEEGGEGSAPLESDDGLFLPRVMPSWAGVGAKTNLGRAALSKERSCVTGTTGVFP